MKVAKRNKVYSPFFNTFFDDIFTKDLYHSGDLNNYSIPSTNIKEDEKSFEIELAVPGLKKEDFSIEVEDGKLIIASEVKTENETKKENYTRKEFNYSSFKKSFVLPEEVSDGEINAKYNDGILSIVLPKAEKTIEKKKMITIG